MDFDTLLYCCKGVFGCKDVVMWLLRCSEWVLIHFYAVARVFQVFWELLKCKMLNNNNNNNLKLVHWICSNQ